ncbi:hypothetical protein [Streptomyces silaceus]|uniref:hypothetical protein n=1 Tax=Streptomyces silaceus TaxID=545123 RepID=UPI0006EB4BF4|nr:hypothetical protein [Streptomyces silaceus]
MSGVPPRSSRLETAVGLVCFAGAFLLVALTGDAVWRRGTAVCPGGAYVFGGLVGFLALAVWPAADTLRRRARAAGTPARKAAGLRVLAAGACVAGAFAVTAALAFLRGRNGVALGAVFHDGPTWVEENPEAAWTLAPGLAVGLAVLLAVALRRPGTGRRGRPRGARRPPRGAR